MGVHYNKDGSVELSEVDQATGDEIEGGKTLLIPPGASKEEQDRRILAFFAQDGAS